jgi:hypothetical protein
MKHMVDNACLIPMHRTHTVPKLANISFDKAKSRPLIGGYERGDLIEVSPMTRSEIIEAYDLLVQLQQRLKQVAAYKPRDAGDQPGPGLLAEQLLNLVVPGHLFSNHNRPSAVPGGSVPLTS